MPCCRKVRDLLLEELGGTSPPAGAVVLAGTDTLEELAYCLHLMLGTALRRRFRAPLVLTGAMLPADQLGGDNAKNLRDALLVGAGAPAASAPLLFGCCCACCAWRASCAWAAVGARRPAAGPLDMQQGPAPHSMPAHPSCLPPPTRACAARWRPTLARRTTRCW